MEDENFFEKCRTCQHCYTKNDDDYVYCRKRNEKCEYKPYKLRGRRMKKEVDGVVVEAKSILTALKIIKTVCEDNNCLTCPFGKNDFFCSITDTTPNAWKINSDTGVWRALR